MKNFEKILDININYIEFRNFIDAIGGIEVYIEQDMYYDDETQDLHINFKKGKTVLLNGKMTEEYFRLGSINFFTYDKANRTINDVDFTCNC